MGTQEHIDTFTQQDALYQADVVDRKNYLGPLVIGSILEIALFGVLMMQMRNYHRHSSHDNLLLKLTAWGSFCGALVLTAAVFVDARYRCILGSTPLLQDAATPSSELASVVIMLLEAQSQIFCAWRISALSRKRWIAALVSCLAITAFVCFVSANAHAWAPRPPRPPPSPLVSTAGLVYDFIHTPSRYSSWTREAATATWRGTSVACNAAITATMALLQYAALRDAGLGQKRPKCGRILKLVFETGIITTICAAVMAGLLFSKAPATQYLRNIFYYPSGVLYSSWLLASLAGRCSTRNETSRAMNIAGTNSTHLGELRFQPNTNERDALTVTILSAPDAVRDYDGQSSAESFDESLAPVHKGGPQHSLV
ncbi:hypothetical protein EYR40_009939 [Pleurotus pulmonarius]|nr:hypothetical protein EYR40_009939 [Pleurotus pulmonarius]